MPERGRRRRVGLLRLRFRGGRNRAGGGGRSRTLGPGCARCLGADPQRVALARALAVRPRLLLLDEPFAAIDYDGRAELREVLRRTLALHETPAVFITHDPQEALALGDRLLKFERGRSVGTGTPSEFLGEATA